MRLYLILAIILLISVYPSFCKEIAYAIGPDGEKPIGSANITDYKGTDVVSFTVSADTRGPSTSHKAQRTVDDIKAEINKKVDKGNDLVRDEGLRLVGKRSGAQRIDQICSIYDFMVGNWTFVSDWSGLDVFQYSNYTLRMGNEVGSSGKGDCDDFSILLASLIESIGGTPRIIFAYSPAGGHAYTEVYLGKSNNKDLDRMLRWLRTEYNTADVSIHADPENGDVWLNMDWWKDSGGATHPGGPFYQATSHIPIYTLEDAKAPLTPIENLPPRVSFSSAPLEPEIRQVVNFDASNSSSPNPNGKIVKYEWNFGDGTYVQGPSRSAVPHIYQESGKFRVNLTITDNEGDKRSKNMDISVKERHLMSKTNYSIDVYTSSVNRKYKLGADPVDGPGTNAFVEVTLYGEQGGFLKPVLLNDNLDNFKSGTRNNFMLYNVTNIGNITKIEIKFKERLSGLRTSDDWHLNKVVITNYETNVSKTFEINDWLTKDGSYSYPA